MASNMLGVVGRNFNTFMPILASLKEPLTVHLPSRHIKTAQLWKKVFFMACVPVLGLAGLSVYLSEEGERPEFKKYPYLRIRKKNFPWGDGNKTLFHNSHFNPLPDGYETELHH